MFWRKKKKPAEPTPSEIPPVTPGTSPDGSVQPDRLTQLNRELYSREESSTIKDRDQELHQLGIRRAELPPAAPALEEQPILYQKITDMRAKRRRRWIMLGGGTVVMLVLLGAAIAGTLWYRVRHNVTQEQIVLTLAAPSEVAAGENITYKVQVRNNSFVKWQNIEVDFEPPRGFRYLESSVQLERANKQYSFRLAELDSQQEQTVEITGQIIGEQNATINASAEMLFTPENFPSGQFTKSIITPTTIASVPVEVAMDASDESESGQRLVLTLQVRNTSNNPLPASYLKINPSAGMQLAVDDPAFSPGFSVLDTTWDLGTLAPLSEITRQVVMFVDGQPGERRTIDAEVGVNEGEEKIIQRQQSHVVTITASALAIEQFYNDATSTLTVTPGEQVNGVLRYTNIGSTGLKNVVLKVKFEGAGLDVGTLRLQQGAYDPIEKTITWTAATVPELATLQPQQEGMVRYDFRVLPVEGFPTQGEDIKNNTLIAMANIDSPDLVTATGEKRNLVTDRTVLSVATTLKLSVDSFYDDGRLGITSDGPLPPKVGEQTTYTVRFRVGSTLNDVGDVQMRAVLPDGVKFTDKTYKTTGDITFNDRTGELLWKIPRLEGLTGRVKPEEELHVQVAIIPGENQIGKTITFLNQLRVEGTDLFTDNQVTQQVGTFPDTEQAAKDKGQVE